ncbi:MAG: transglutaminase-like cysteine peptidase [Hyphomicrobiaceae bacterium]|nr:transglutaminase-like cysteine peptidase [Hyphomicrobiaceae bacterium]
MPALADTRTSSSPAMRQTAYMRVFGSANPPYGFVRFCDLQPGHCASDRFLEDRFRASPELLSDLDDVNRLVNRTITPQTDQELYGTTEYWTLPTTSGDCEDYVLLKRQLLIARGWPASALLITVVRDEVGDGHAVLTARTSQGDFVLDNKLPDVRIWYTTPYEFVMRQSYVNPRVWVSLEERLGDSPPVIAGSGARD